MEDLSEFLSIELLGASEFSKSPEEFSVEELNVLLLDRFFLLALSFGGSSFGYI
jgi:hypothetical protein